MVPSLLDERPHSKTRVPKINGTIMFSELLAALLLAVAGGLVLNIMPCVFPILSLKVLSLAKSGAAPDKARRNAVALLR